MKLLLQQKTAINYLYLSLFFSKVQYAGCKGLRMVLQFGSGLCIYIAKSVRASLAFYYFASNIVSYEMSQVVILSKIANTLEM